MGILRHTWHNEGKPENRLLHKTLRRAVLWLTTLLVLCYYKPVPKTGAQLNKRR